MQTKWIQEYFSFTKKERIAVIVLSVLIVLIFLLPGLIPVDHKAPSIQEVNEVREMAQQIRQVNNQVEQTRSAESKRYNARSDYAVINSPPEKLFYFDPNNISAYEWRQLGLRDKTIGTIQKYLSKGGHFYKPTDLQKIYGLKPDEYRRLEPYIRIHDERKSESSERFGVRDVPLKAGYVKQKHLEMVDINLADSSALIALPGIGSKLAARIIHFREKLGGFHSVDQIAETYGLADSSFQKLKPFLKAGDAIRKININTAEEEVLRSHPYIKWGIAKALVRYRDQHGPFKTVDELQQIAVVTPDAYRKIAPYVTLE